MCVYATFLRYWSLHLCAAEADGEACVSSVLCIKGRCEVDLPSWTASDICNTGIQLLLNQLHIPTSQIVFIPSDQRPWPGLLGPQKTELWHYTKAGGKRATILALYLATIGLPQQTVAQQHNTTTQHNKQWHNNTTNKASIACSTINSKLGGAKEQGQSSTD